MTKVYISRTDPETGVGQVAHAIARHLPAFGIEVTDSPDDADVIAGHVVPPNALPRIDVHHLHGLHGTGPLDNDRPVAHDHAVNRALLAIARRAHAITIPSEWAAQTLRRDLRFPVRVIPNGVDAEAWHPRENRGYILWNKSRRDAVCDPAPAYALAQRGLSVVSTFMPPGVGTIRTAQVIGRVPHSEMRGYIQHADLYLATTREVHSVSVLESMAAGVPVLGYGIAGTAETIQHQVTGYLVEPGDIDGLCAGAEWLRSHRDEISRNCREYVAQHYDWPIIVAQYADLYHEVAERRQQESHGVAVVIPCYNYGRYLGEALESVLAQSQSASEIVVVDDGSTDNSREVAARYGDRGVRYIYQENLGVSYARNRGITATSAPYIICLDADDMLHPDYIATLQPHIAADRALGIVYGGLAHLRADGSCHPSSWPPPFNWERHIRGNHIPCSAMFRRDMWERAGGYHATYYHPEDYEFWLRGLSVGFDARRVTHQSLFLYRSHGRNKSASATNADMMHVFDWLPWGHDGDYPAGAPAQAQPLVRHYREPPITVVIPVGPGHAQWLPSALESLIGQTLREWHVIVVNDTGVPLPAHIMRPYPFVETYHTAGSQGAGAARNIGLQHVRSPLVLWLDADDWLHPVALDMMYQAMRASEADYIYSDYMALDDNGKLVTHETHNYSQRSALYRGLHAVTVLMWTEDARRVQGFDETLSALEDTDFFARCAVAGICGQRIPMPLLGYRVGAGTRRAAALRSGEQARIERDVLWPRWMPYRDEKEVKMCGCNKKARGLPASRARGGIMAATDTTVRLQYIGTQQGAVSFRGAVTGTMYRGGNTPHHRYADVDVRDVEGLAATGRWQRVPRPAQVQSTDRVSRPIGPPVPAIVEPETEQQPSERKRRRRRSALSETEASQDG